MKVTFLKSAVKDAKKIKLKKVQLAIKETVKSLQKVNHLKNIPNIKKMSGHPNAYRIRIGDYRLGFYYDNDTIAIARILKRNDIYKLFP